MFASDADSGINGQIEFSIVSGNSNEAFILDSVRGILATNVLLDREITPSYKYANRSKRPDSQAKFVLKESPIPFCSQPLHHHYGNYTL